VATNLSTSPASAASGRVRKSPGRGWIAIVVIVVAGVAGVGWWLHANRSKAESRPGETADSTGADASFAETVAVATIHPGTGGIEKRVTQIGSIHPMEQAELFAKISGYLDKLNVDYGSRVKRGELLAEISDPEVVKEAARSAAAVVRAESAVRQAEARLKNAYAEVEAAKAAVQQAEAYIASTVAAVSYRKKRLDRYTALVARNAETQAVVDEEEHNYEAAQAAEAASRAALETARAQLVASRAKVDIAIADLQEARDKVDENKQTLARDEVFVGYTKIRSPYDGVITKRNFFRGAFIRSAADGNPAPLLTVARTDFMRVVVMVPDSDVPYLDVGKPAEFRVGTLGGQVFKGKVSRFSYNEDPSSRTMHTEIDLPNPQGRLKEGMFGLATIELGVNEHALTIPAACLVGESHGGKAEVLVVKNGKAAKQLITIGANDGIRVEVIGGLTEKDEVITTTTGVSDGTPVRTRKSADTPAPAAAPGARGQATETH
jgi:RND family efflux transporter MFP subunit